MKIENEIKGLKNILQCKEEIKVIQKRSIVTGISCFVIGVSIITLLILFVVKESTNLTTYFLFSFGGIFIAISYVKYTEKVGLKLIADYFDYEKVKKRLTELNVKPEDQVTKADSPYKTVSHFLVWLLIGATLVFFKNYV